MFLNDLAITLKQARLGVRLGNIDICILLYADDMVIICPTAEKLQEALHVMHDWFHKWKLIISSEKTEVVHFRPKGCKKTESVFHCGDKVLKIAEEYKYLGIHLDSNLLLTKAGNERQLKGSKALNQLLQKSKRVNCFSFKVFSKLYDTCVTSVTDYGISIWGCEKMKCKDNVYFSAIRRFFGLPKHTNLAGLKSISLWLPQNYRMMLEKIRLWNRLCKMAPDRLTKRVFIFDQHKLENNWSKDFLSVCKLIGEEDAFSRICPIDAAKAKDTLSELFVSECRHEIENASRLSALKEITLPPKCMSLPNRTSRNLAVKLILGVLKLRVETGRFENLARDDRRCIICSMDEVEDSSHFICVCPTLNDPRVKLNDMLPIVPLNVEYYVSNLMNCITNKISSIIYDMWTKRLAFLYTGH